MKTSTETIKTTEREREKKNTESLSTTKTFSFVKKCSLRLKITFRLPFGSPFLNEENYLILPHTHILILMKHTRNPQAPRLPRQSALSTPNVIERLSGGHP